MISLFAALFGCPSAPEAPPTPTPPAAERPPLPPKLSAAVAACAPTTSTITIQLGQSQASLADLYPVRTSLPDPYDQPTRPSQATYLPDTLNGSIELFTRSSLVADGFTVASLVADAAAGTVTVTATGCNLADYQTQLPAFLAAGAVGYGAWTQCQASGQPCAGMDVPHPCTSNPSETCIPWEFYLPLGQPLVNHWGVMLLDYPPADALCGADYQNNFTMHRWNQVLAWGVEPTIWWAGIVDAHPIAANGSGESSGIQAAGPFFTAYQAQMLQVVTNPPSLASRSAYGAGYTLPVMPSGTPAHKAWAAIIGAPVATLGMDKTTNLVAGKSTPWVATNHPDVSTYQCCPGDTSESCCDGTWSAGTCTGEYGWSDDLAEDEESDFTGVCYFENISLQPGAAFADFALTCARGILWGQSTLCVQGRMDYQFSSEGHCGCEAAAEAFCAENSWATCPSATQVTSCAPYEQLCTDPSPGYVECQTQ